MGRNETINDAPVLQDAWQANEASGGGGGSMKALLTSRLTSDTFLYRTRSQKTLSDAKKLARFAPEWNSSFVLHGLEVVFH